ncbi:hypothetical protein ACJ41O_011543 [Fusarium nematophilum]
MPRACRNCRMRKVRCNRVVPCSNCLTSSLECVPDAKSAARAARHVPEATSHHDSKGLLEKISALEEAVSSLQQQQQQQQQQGARSHSHSQPTPPRHASDSGQTRQGPQGVNDHRAALPEGDSSFGSQALHASQIAELTSSEASQSPIVMLELAKLRDMAQDQTAPRSVRHHYLSGLRREGPKSDMELPPSDFVVQVLRVLREMKGTESLLFTFYGISGCTQVEDLCKRIYFPVELVSTGEVTLFNGILSIILRELISLAPESHLTQDIKYYQTVCEKNFQMGAETFEVMAIPTTENAMILSLAMIHAQTKAKLPLQWSLTSTAARHCLTLGYHREDRVSQLSPAEAERVRRLFWHVYINDKNLATRLGRGSTIQEFDIDVKPCAISDDPEKAPWDKAFVTFIDLARIQGRIYEGLYAPAARKLDPEARAKTAADLDSQLKRWYSGWVRLDLSTEYNKEIFDLTFGPAHIAYYSILTLLHRGTTLSGSAHDISPACFEAAHQGMTAHMTYVPRLTALGDRALNSYAFWIFYYTSFTPYVVTFVHCITTSDRDDLKLLQDVLGSLEQIGLTLEYAETQYNLCKALYRIAEAFITSRRATPGDDAGGGMSTLYLPLQNPFPDNWAWLDPASQLPSFLGAGAEDWVIPDADQTLFSLDHHL